MNFHNIPEKEQKFYKDFYPSVDTLCRTIDHFSKTGESFEVDLGENLLDKTFKTIRDMEKELIGEEVDITELKITDDEYFEILDKLYLLREKVEKKFDALLLSSF